MLLNLWYSLEGMMLKLKLQYIGHLMQRANSLERPWCRQRLAAGGEGDDRRWDGWMASLTQWRWVWTSSRSWWWTEKPGELSPWGCKELDMTEWPNWTDPWFTLIHKVISKNIMSLCLSSPHTLYTKVYPPYWSPNHRTLKLFLVWESRL